MSGLLDFLAVRPIEWERVDKKTNHQRARVDVYVLDVWHCAYDGWRWRVNRGGFGVGAGRARSLIGAQRRALGRARKPDGS